MPSSLSEEVLSTGSHLVSERGGGVTVQSLSTATFVIDLHLALARLSLLVGLE